MTRQPISEPLTIPPATATNTSGLETCIFPTATFIGLRRWAGGRSDPVPRCGAATTSKGVGGVTQYVDEGRVGGECLHAETRASLMDGERAWTGGPGTGDRLDWSKTPPFALPQRSATLSSRKSSGRQRCWQWGRPPYQVKECILLKTGWIPCSRACSDSRR